MTRSGLAVMIVADDPIADRLDDRAEHVLHPRIVARKPAQRLVGPNVEGAVPRWLGEQPVSIDQLGRLAADQRHSADLTRIVGGMTSFSIVDKSMTSRKA
jgi:hypothetical protein